MTERPLNKGIYEEILTGELGEALFALESSDGYRAIIGSINEDEQELLIKHHLFNLLSNGIELIRAKHSGLAQRVAAYNRLIGQLEVEVGARQDATPQIIEFPIKRLEAILPEGSTLNTNRPHTSLLTSDLFTGSSRISVAEELKREIITADRIDLLVSFIKYSGLTLIWDALVEFTHTRNLRIITTSYMSATDPQALEKLSSLPNTEIKVSYDTTRTRLHAKAYLFHRSTGYSTAFIGSSNMSSSAMLGGLEWNMRISQKETPHIIEGASVAFDTYWEDADFLPYDADQFSVVTASQKNVVQSDSGWQFDVRPYPFQQTILDSVQAARDIHGRYRNLIVAATGTGKTVMAAFDFKRFQAKHPNVRLLFIAHRKEILTQARSCFRTILKSPNFGELAVDGSVPSRHEHVFMSIQSINAKEISGLFASDYYDYVVIDEFHHSAAPSYKRLLDYINPKILLGLTGTPERMDGVSIQDLYFDGHIDGEVRLPEAIGRQLLTPFQYCCVDDPVDISALSFKLGRYDSKELESLYTFNDARARAIANAVTRYLPDPRNARALGFCVTVKHAEYMAQKFTEYGFKAAVLHGSSSKDARAKLPRELAKGDINYLFTVDLFNEGVDIPEIDTVLFLRPTESLTVFLQQLGRGLRVHPSKEILTVLDFVGQAHEQYRFEDKLRALLANTTTSIEKQISTNNYALPPGCSIVMEPIAQEVILNNVKKAINKVSLIKKNVKTYLNQDSSPNLLRFLEMYPQTQLDKLYNRSNTFGRLCKDVMGVALPNDDTLRTQGIVASSLLNADSWHYLNFFRSLFSGSEPKLDDSLSTCHLAMMYYSVHQRAFDHPRYGTMSTWFDEVCADQDFATEMVGLCSLRMDAINFVQDSLDLGFEHALKVHCSYTRSEILAALGNYNEQQRPESREGVKYLPQRNLDIFFITLDKEDKDFVESQRYDDYAISENVFHWQSQSTTSDTSPTGQRYIHHDERNSNIVLFIRRNTGSRFICAGKAHYEKHEGSRPMSIRWRMELPLPETLL